LNYFSSYALQNGIKKCSKIYCFKRHVSEVAFPIQQIWNFVGNWLVEAHTHGNAQAMETELLKTRISFAVLP
jgi:hypothetical protein